MPGLMGNNLSILLKSSGCRPCIVRIDQIHRLDRPDASSGSTGCIVWIDQMYRLDRPDPSSVYRPDRSIEYIAHVSYGYYLCTIHYTTCGRYKVTRGTTRGTIRSMSNLEAQPYNVEIPSTYSQDASSESF